MIDPEDDFEDFDNGEDDGNDGASADDARDIDAGDEPGHDDGDVDHAQPADQGGRADGGSSERAQPRVRSRAQERVEEALNRSRAAEEKAQRLEGQLNELLNGRRGETEAQERARVEQMDPYERTQYETDQRMARIERALGQVAQTGTDASDRAAFAAEVARNPVLKSVADRVETTRAQLVQQSGGQHVPRVLVAQLILGQDVAAGKMPGKRKPSERMERNRTTPPGGRSDVGGSTPARGKTDDAAARRKRLENLQL